MQALQACLASLCGDLAPDSVPLPEIGALWSSFDAIGRLAAGATCRLAARVEESRAWQRDGERSAAEWMARRSGTTPGRARATLEASRRLAELPATDQALAKGGLSGPQVEAITDAAAADPSSEGRLLATARRRALRELHDDCARVKARAEDATARAARLHRQRCLRTWKGGDGSWNLGLRTTPEAGAEIAAALAPLREQLFQQARLQGRGEATEAYAADALSELVRLGAEASGHHAPMAATATDDDGAPGSGSEVVAAGRTARSRRPDTKVIVLIDYEALRRGHGEADEVCEIAGVGPIPVATARSLMADAVGAAVVTDAVDVYTVAHVGRSVSAHQRSALEARGYRCEVPGCGATRALEIDHLDEWWRTGHTHLQRLAWLCRRHHLAKTHQGWRLEGTVGDRRWVAPGDRPPGPDPPPPAAQVTDDTGRRCRQPEHHQRLQAPELDQGQPGQGVGVDAVGLGVAAAEPSQVSGLGRADPTRCGSGR